MRSTLFASLTCHACPFAAMQTLSEKCSAPDAPPPKVGWCCKACWCKLCSAICACHQIACSQLGNCNRGMDNHRHEQPLCLTMCQGGPCNTHTEL